MPLNAVSAHDLCVRYDSAEVLSELSFEIARGDYVGLVGPNGSGKSTLIRAMLGLIRPSKGCVRLFGYHVHEFAQWKKLGYLPQKMAALNPHFPCTVGEVVATGMISGKRFPRRAARADDPAIRRALDLLNIADLKDAIIGDLSGGQQQRAFIARALVNEPELLILDEPTAALDPETRETFYALMHDLNVRSGVTVIFVTHDIGTIGKYATKLMYVDKGLVFFGSFDDFCRSDTMARFFGESSQHIICHKHD